MNLEQKLDNIAATSKLMRLADGKACDIEEFWNNFIEPNLPCEEAVIGWHSILLKYIKDNPTFSLRVFGSYVNKQNDPTMLRRGFVNTCNQNFKTVYADNFFTSYFFSMAYDNYVPDYEEFKKMMDSRKFPAGYMSTREEDKYRGFQRGKDPKIQFKGYKIAHIYDAGRNFDFAYEMNTVGKFCKLYFPRGEYDDWNGLTTDRYGTYHCRDVKIENQDKQKVYDFLVAHFLRTVHPINYFLVPKQGLISFYDNGVLKDEIGEYEPLIQFVEKKISERYKKIYGEYLQLIAPLQKSQKNFVNYKIDAQYGFTKKISVNKESQKKYCAVATKVQKQESSTLKIGQIARQYLIPALMNGCITKDELQKLKDAGYSEKVFGIRYPLLSQERVINGYPRYYATPITLDNKQYYVCQEWHETSMLQLKIWLKSHNVDIEKL